MFLFPSHDLGRLKSTQTTAGTWDASIEEISSSQNTQIPIVSDWITETSTITGVTSNPTKGTTARDILRWRRVGQNMEIMFHYQQTGAGAAGSGYYLLEIPNSEAVDTDIVAVNTDPEIEVGRGIAGSSSNGLAATMRPTGVYVYDANNLYFILNTTSSNNIQDSREEWGSGGAIPLSGTSILVTVNASIPISGWSSTR